MKKYALLSLALLSLASCKKDPAPEITPEIQAQHEVYTVSHESGVLQIQIHANVEFDVAAPSTWTNHVSTTLQEEGVYLVDMAIDGNASKVIRHANVTFSQKGGGERQTVVISQPPAPVETAQDFLMYRHLFVDNVFGELRPDVPLDTIMAIHVPLLRNIALALYHGEYPTEFRVQSYRAWANPATERATNKTWFPWSLLDNPTGIRVSPTQEFTIFVGATHGRNISLRVIDFSQTNGFSNPMNRILTPGFNRFEMPIVGLAYILYHADDFENAPLIDIHIASGEVNGYFDINKHAPEEWMTRLNQATDAHFDLVGRYAHVIFPTADFKTYTGDRGVRLIEVYDSIVSLQKEHIGLFKYDRANRNRSLFTVTPDQNAYMYASTNRTVYARYTLNRLCNPDDLRTTAIWGPAHEVGHTLQTTGFNWVGMSEVSNNVSSMFVQAAFGNTSRLLEVNNGKTTYQHAIEGIIDGKAVHGIYGDVFHKLVPFWQLQLYFAKAQGYTDFYADLYEIMRAMPVPNASGEQQLYFIKVACDLTQLDLTDFFEAWGMLALIDQWVNDYTPRQLTITQGMVDALKQYASQYSKPAHRIQDIRDDNWELFR